MRMDTNRRSIESSRPWIYLMAVLLPLALALTVAAPASADDMQKATQLVEKARMTMDSFMNDNMMDAFRDLIKDARGVFIAPQVLRGAFVWGASGGSGVFLVRDDRTGEWTGPAFYTIGGASFGLQIGGEASEVILLAMTDRGVNALMSSSVKLGADVGLAVGPVGAGASAATANLSADIISFSRSKGLYGGISLTGAVVATRGDLNDAYYGTDVRPADIFIRHEVKNPHAAPLIDAVTRSACVNPRSGRC
jgi:lipid-binding SYLF domain-containing protein